MTSSRAVHYHQQGIQCVPTPLPRYRTELREGGAHIQCPYGDVSNLTDEEELHQKIIMDTHYILNSAPFLHHMHKRSPQCLALTLPHASHLPILSFCKGTLTILVFKSARQGRTHFSPQILIL